MVSSSPWRRRGCVSIIAQTQAECAGEACPGLPCLRSEDEIEIPRQCLRWVGVSSSHGLEPAAARRRCGNAGRMLQPCAPTVKLTRERASWGAETLRVVLASAAALRSKKAHAESRTTKVFFGRGDGTSQAIATVRKNARPIGTGRGG